MAATSSRTSSRANSRWSFATALTRLADQALNVLVRNGDFYWIRRDGHSYPTGPRAVTILARARDGRPLTYTGSVNVPELTGVTPADPPAQEAGSNGQDPP